MSLTKYSYSLYSTRKPVVCAAGALLLLGCFCLTTSYAEDSAAMRARVIQEVLEEVPEIDLAKQIVEIRLKREFLNQQTTISQSPKKEQSPIKIPSSKRVLIRQPVQNESRPSDVDTKNWNQ
jgi:hypothetical protein